MPVPFAEIPIVVADGAYIPLVGIVVDVTRTEPIEAVLVTVRAVPEEEKVFAPLHVGVPENVPLNAPPLDRVRADAKVVVPVIVVPVAMVIAVVPVRLRTFDELYCRFTLAVVFVPSESVEAPTMFPTPAIRIAVLVLEPPVGGFIRKLIAFVVLVAAQVSMSSPTLFVIVAEPAPNGPPVMYSVELLVTVSAVPLVMLGACTYRVKPAMLVFPVLPVKVNVPALAYV